MVAVISLAAVLMHTHAFAATGTGTASVKGSISFEGTPPEPTTVKMNADPACLAQQGEGVDSNEVVVDAQGNLKNVFVFVKSGIEGEYPVPKEPVTLDQNGCWYEPHVLGIQVNQPLEISNSDATLHNVNAQAKTNRPFNIAQPVQNMKTTKKFTKPERMVSVKCNVHPWMQSYIGVMEHPFYAVSGADGNFTIANLPAGTYEIEAWHEVYGGQTQRVTVADGEAASVAFVFKAQ